MAIFKRAQKTPFRLTYGTVLPNHRSGGETDVLSNAFRSRTLKDAPYNCLLEATCSAEKIYPLFSALTAFVDPACMAILEDHKSEATVTYASTRFLKERVLDRFGEHSFQLVNDGFTGFGLASESFEVFVPDHKEVRIYCHRLPATERVLRSFNLEENGKLALIGSLKHYHADLGAFFDSELSKLAEPLPAPEMERFKRDPNEYNRFRQAVVSSLEMQVQSRTAAT